MRLHILITLFFLLALSIASAQSNKLDKKMENAYNLVDKGKLEDADEYMVKLVKQNPEYGPGWDYLSKIRYKEYTSAQSLDNIFGGSVTVTTKDKDGKEVAAKDDSLGQQLMAMLNNLKPSELAYDKFKYTLRKGTLLSTDAYQSSQMLRAFFVDPEVDTAVSKKALKYFDDAEEEFGKKNFSSASKLYKRAIEEQPDFYKASLYLGDCYYFMGDYANAITSFKAAVDRFPTLVEPRKYLVDAYSKEHLYEQAIDEAIIAMAVYPDVSLAVKLDDAAYMNNQSLDIKHTLRGVFPNSLTPDKSGLQYSDPDSLIANSPWTFYREALPTIKGYCNEQGLITKPNSLTQSKYLEVYSWEQMLKNSTDSLLEEARKMQKDGFLDCYVMVSCYHYDFYDQYAHFVAQNKDRVVEYYKKYLVARK